MAVNRFFRRQTENRYVPTTMQEMMVLPSSRLAIQSEAHSSINQMQPLFNVRPQDMEGATNSINQFTSEVDNLRNSLMNQGATDPTVQDKLSKLSQTYKANNSTGGIWSLYQKGYNEFQAEDATYQKKIETSDNPQWWSDLRSAFHSMNNAPTVDENGNYVGIKSGPKVDYIELNKVGFEALNEVEMDEISYTNPTWAATLGQLGIQPVPNAEGTVEFRDQDKMLGVMMMLSQDPKIQQFLQTNEALYGIPSGFSEDNLWYKVDENGNFAGINTANAFGQMAQYTIAAKSTVKDKMKIGDGNTSLSGMNTYLENNNKFKVSHLQLPNTEKDLNSYGSLSQVTDALNQQVNAYQNEYTKRLDNSAVLFGLDKASSAYAGQSEMLMQAAITASTKLQDNSVEIDQATFLSELQKSGAFTPDQLTIISKSVQEQNSITMDALQDLSELRFASTQTKAQLEYYNTQLAKKEADIFQNAPELKTTKDAITKSQENFAGAFGKKVAEGYWKNTPISMSHPEVFFKLLPAGLQTTLTSLFNLETVAAFDMNLLVAAYSDTEQLNKFSDSLGEMLSTNSNLLKIATDGMLTEKDVIEEVQNLASEFYKNGEIGAQMAIAWAAAQYEDENNSDSIDTIQNYYEDLADKGIQFSKTVSVTPSRLHIAWDSDSGVRTENLKKRISDVEKHIQVLPTMYMVAQDKAQNILQYLAEQNDANIDDIAITNVSDLAIHIAGDGKNDDYSVHVNYKVGKQTKDAYIPIRASENLQRNIGGLYEEAYNNLGHILDADKDAGLKLAESYGRSFVADTDSVDIDISKLANAKDGASVPVLVNDGSDNLVSYRVEKKAGQLYVYVTNSNQNEPVATVTDAKQFFSYIGRAHWVFRRYQQGYQRNLTNKQIEADPQTQYITNNFL